VKNLNLDIMRPIDFHDKIHKLIKSAQINVINNSGWKKNLKCPVCYSRKKKIWLRKINIDIFEYLNCKTGYSSLVPKNFSEIYDINSEIEKKIKTHKRRSGFFLKKFGTERIKFIKKFKKNENLLDFGCGTGAFVNFAKKSFKVNAFDYSLKLSKFVEKKLPIK
jgi:2-polyprenyl-3-methyl-5-hydroxy-6-metoxy-1,4-benzoquinol methylase